MTRHLTNATYGVLDYASYPATMLVVAPIVLRRLGAAEYGLWILATSVISAGGILASGFCDAGMQRIARLRAENKIADAARTVRSLLAINLACGSVLAILVWLIAPLVSNRVAVSHLTSARECLYSLWMSGTWILLRALDSAAVVTHRAFEEYRVTVQISITSRLVALTSAAVLALLGYRVLSILIATGVALALGVCLQFLRLRDHFGTAPLWPEYDGKEIRLVLRPGFFVWMQSVCGVLFGHLDRILLAVSFGAAALAPYAICVQFAQPIFGLSASGLHFIFPLISRRAANVTGNALHVLLAKSLACNVLVVTVTSTALLVFGIATIRLWAGPAISAQARSMFPEIILGSAFMGLGVTGTYAMQALGRFRTVALLNIGGRICALLLLIYLLRHWGIQGVIVARICYGATALLVYVPLCRYLWLSRPQSPVLDYAAAELQEGQS